MESNFFLDNAGKEAAVTVLIFTSTIVWKLATCFLTAYHKGKLHYFIYTNSITQKKTLDYIFYMCQVFDNFKPTDLVFPY